MQRKIIGFGITGLDNGTTFIGDKSRLACCPTCGARYDFFVHNPEYHMGRKRRSDLLFTYDDVPIITQRFRDFVEINGYPGVHSLPFKNDMARFHLVVDSVVPYDQTAPGLEMEEFCKTCQRYNSVATGTEGLILDTNAPLDDGFYRSDLVFGHGHNKTALIVVGMKTRDKMEEYGLKGVCFQPVFGCNAQDQKAGQGP